MKTRRFTRLELVSRNDHGWTIRFLSWNCLRLAGVPWAKWWEMSEDPLTGDVLVRYE